MTRETRLNLWFLVIFLIISLPGAVILFIKKLDPSASRIDEPDAVRMQLPYMAPVPAPPETRWMVPAKTRQWLADLTQQKTGQAMASAVASGPEWEPIISADHRVQAVSVFAEKGMTNLAVIVWNGLTADEVNGLRISLRSNGRDLPASIVKVEWVDVPEDVRHEWVNLGFDHPPKRIAWVDGRAEGILEAGSNVELDLSDTESAVFRTQVSWTVR